MASYGPDSKDDDILSDAKAAFKEAADAEADNRERALDDLRFARLGQQWPDAIARQRQLEGRPMLTINKLPAFIRQVVNDSRQNKPSTKVRPVDSKGDPETAEILNGIIRNIESNSSADVAYDTAIENAVSMGFGYWRIGMRHASDDTFDMDLTVDRVADPMTIYGDPWATGADGSDWNSAFVVERMSHKRFEQEYKDADKVSWSADGQHDPNWLTSDWVQVAEWWVRERVMRTIMRLSDGTVIDVEKLKDEEFLFELQAGGLTPDGQTREVPSYKVKQCILTDHAVLERRDWPGRYIPIVPVYGDEINEEGKRHFFSLVHQVKDAQRQFNYWRTTATELVALAPRVPVIGPKGSFVTDAEKWATINTQSHAFIEYDDKGIPPQRQPLGGNAAGEIQQALMASDDMKAVVGIYDASLGARSNETSGRAIMARQREGDVSTFHFIDNLTRAIRQSGRILIDLIPHVWSDERIVRLMNEDGTVEEQKVNGPVPVINPETGQPEMEPDPSVIPMPGMQPPMRPKTRVFSLTTGKYDVTATSGPSFTTKREESAQQMIELVRAFPAAAQVMGDLLARNLDWPGADEIAERLEKLYESTVGGGGGIPPEVQKQIQAGMQELEKLKAENQSLKGNQQVEAMQLEVEKAKLTLEAEKLKIERFKAETDRMQIQADVATEGMKMQAQAARPQTRPANGSAVR